MAGESPFLGIDLGTSNSVAAYVCEGRAFVVGDADGRTVHPSVVAFTEDGRVVVGASALDSLHEDPQNTLFSVKRLIGRRFSDEEVQRLRDRVGYAIRADADGIVVLQTRAGTHTVQEVSAHILRYLRDLAETQLGAPLERAVITVPASFHNLQRQATKEAGEKAGFSLVRILNEPTAAALSYGFGRGLSQRVAVYDFGGGTLDVTVLNIEDNVFEVLATAGDTSLGGDDMDIRVAEAMAGACLRTHRFDVRHDPIAMSRLRRYAEALKCRLSEEDSVTIEVPDIAFGEDGLPLPFTVVLDRPTFAQRMSDLVERSIRVFEESLRLAKVDAPALLDDTILVGGSTRIPLIRERLALFLGKLARTDVNPMQAVAMGAAIHAATLGQNVEEEGAVPAQPRPVLLDVTPRALGIGIVGGLCETLIPRNTAVPAEETRVFATSVDHQTKVRIPIAQGESRKLKENVSLGVLELDGLPPKARGALRVAVTFEINTDGILEVRAANKDTGRRERVRIVLGQDALPEGTAPLDGDLEPPPA
ncbi:MAG: Hsp70 family protein [Myxococcota bacterium]